MLSNFAQSPPRASTSPLLGSPDVLLIGNYVNDSQHSMLYFANVLHQSLCSHHVPNILIAPQPVLGKLCAGRSGLGKWFGYIDKILLFPICLRRTLRSVRRPILLHICDHSNAFYSLFTRARPILVTCHDMIALRSALGEFAEHRTRWTGRQLHRLIRRGLCAVDHAVCDTIATQTDLSRLLGISKSRTSVIYQGLNHPYQPMSRRASLTHVARLLLTAGFRDDIAHGVAGDYIFHVGSNNWYKNRSGILRAYAAFSRGNRTAPKLIIAGRPLVPEHHRFISESGIGQHVFVLTKCQQVDLTALYSGARLLLFPSLIEGFGLPIIEAQSCGCPVVTTNRPPMTEVGGEGCVYCDATNPYDIAAAIRRTLALSEEARARLVDAGRKNALNFSTDRMTNGYVSLYSTLSNSFPKPIDANSSGSR